MLAVVLTSDKMLRFALECLQAAERAPDQRQFDLMLSLARSWMRAAKAAKGDAGDPAKEDSMPD